MPKDAIDVQAAAAAADYDRKLQTLRGADTDSLKELAKSAYAEVARIRAMAAPMEENLALAQRILHERLLAEDRSVINDPDFVIALESAGNFPATKDDAAILRALVELRVDGDPIPPNELVEAAWEETPPPPQPIVKTNLTKLKSLVKKYGKPVQAIIDAHVSAPPKPKRFVFQPKEQHVRDASPAIGRADGEATPS